MKKTAVSQKNKFPPNDQNTLLILDEIVKQKSVRVAIDTAPEDELIEERPNPADTQSILQRLYLDEQ